MLNRPRSLVVNRKMGNGRFRTRSLGRLSGFVQARESRTNGRETKKTKQLSPQLCSWKVFVAVLLVDVEPPLEKEGGAERGTFISH